MKKFIITDLAKGNANITADQVLEIGGEGVRFSLKGNATQANSPTPYDAVTYPNGLFETYVVRTPLTMPNSWGSAVTQAELDANYVYFDVRNGVVTKSLSKKPVADPAKLPLYSAVKGANIVAGTQFVDDENGDLIYITTATLNTGELPKMFTGIKTRLLNPKTEPLNLNLAGFYNKDTGILGGGAPYYSTEKMKVKAGMVFTNPYLGVGNASQVVFFKTDGSFLSSQLGQTTITAPALADTIAFSVGNVATKIYPPLDFVQYQIDYKNKIDITDGIIKKITIPDSGYYLTTNGGVFGATNFHSAKYKVREGMTFINPYKGVGNIAQAVFFKADGTFLSFVQGQDVVTVPALADTVGFSSDNQTKLITASFDFWAYQQSAILIPEIESKSIFKVGVDFAKIYKTDFKTAPNSIQGFLLDINDSFSANLGFFVTPYIPIRSGQIQISGLVVSAAYTLLYDKNKIVVGRISHTASSVAITIPNYVAYFRTSNNNPIKILAVTDINMGDSVVELPKKITKITENKVVSIGDNKRFTIQFRSKIDLNSANEDLNVISGGVLDLFIKKALTSTSVNSQHTKLNHSVSTKISTASKTLFKEVGSEQIRMFEGEELFRLRHTGTNYNLFWEVKSGFLNLYEGATKLKGYDFTTYDTVGKLLVKIKEDSDGSIIPSFEYFATNLSLIPTSKIASFEKLPAFRTVTKGGGTVSTCFPTYFNKIDDKWHTLEFNFRPNSYLFSVDGMVWNDNGYNFNAKIGGELIFDFTNFEFRNLEISEVADFSFPIIRTVYIHGCQDGIGETTSIGNTVDRTLEANEAFKKRGFQSITYTQLMKHLKFGEAIPKRSYVLCYDDSRNELYTDLNVRKKLIENNIKTNNCAVLSFKNDEEIYIKSADVVFTGNIGDTFSVGNDSKLTYIGISRVNSTHKIFKLGNPANFNGYFTAILIGGTYTSGGSTVKFPTSPFILSVNEIEVPYNAFSPLVQDIPKSLRDYGFDIHIHDYRHAEALDTMTYDEAVDNAKKASELFIQRYGINATGLVYPYGYVTIDHAKIWHNQGVHLGYTSAQDKNQIGLSFCVPYMLHRQQFDSGAAPIRIEDYFTNGVNGLDNWLP